MTTLTDALRELIRAEDEERKAREGYEGGSWGYHGQSFYLARCKAEERFEAALNEVIDARIKAVKETP